MRGFFSGLALLFALAVLGVAAMKQLKTLRGPAVLLPGAAGSATAPGQARPVQEQIKLDINKAIEQGAARIEEATP